MKRCANKKKQQNVCHTHEMHFGTVERDLGHVAIVDRRFTNEDKCPLDGAIIYRTMQKHLFKRMLLLVTTYTHKHTIHLPHVEDECFQFILIWYLFSNGTN